MRLRFGEFTFDGERRALLKGEAEVHLSPKAYRLLDLLVARRPGAVSRTEIRDALWPDTFVSDGGVAILVNELRKALGDEARSARSIRTVRGFGYAFAAEAREVSGDGGRLARHALVWAGEVIALAEGENVLGRDLSAAVLVGHPSVSRRHARIVVRGDRAELEDLGSRNGTFRGKCRVDGRVLLFDGDDVILGSATLVYRGPAASPEVTTKTVR